MGIRKNTKIIGVCGFGYSGSGAVIDFLKSYQEINVIDELEFSLVYTPDGIEDLQHNISLSPSRYWSSDSSIRRFIQLIERKRKSFDFLSKGAFSPLIDNYLKSIIQVKWNGSTSAHIYQESSLSYFFKQRFLRRLVSEYEARFKPLSGHLPPQKTMYYSYMENDSFLDLSRSLVMRIIESISDKKSSLIVLDQPFSANNPEKSFPFFDNPYAIVVTRDPRDTYLLAKKNLGLCGSFVPTDNVEDFILYYKGLMDSMVKSNSEHVVIIRFEDLVYNFSQTKCFIEKFLNISTSAYNNQFFDPNISINNTQLWLKYSQYAQDIKKIEEELASYLYDFTRFEIKPKFNAYTF